MRGGGGEGEMLHPNEICDLEALQSDIVIRVGGCVCLSSTKCVLARPGMFHECACLQKKGYQTWK